MKNGWAFLRFLRACRRGATAVEFALVAPVFLIMTLGVVELGRAIWIKASMQNAAEQTTRYLMVNNSISGNSCSADFATNCQAALEAYATARLAETGMTTADFTVAASETTLSSVTYVDITITYSFVAIAQIVEFPSVSLSARARVPYN